MPRIVLVVLFMAISATTSADTIIVAREAPLRTAGGELESGAWNLWSNGCVGQYFRFDRPGTYRVVVRASGSPAEGVWPEMALLLDGRALATATVTRRSMADYQFSVKLPAGMHELTVGFLNDRRTAEEDRNLYLDRITITPPAGAADLMSIGVEEMSVECRRREEAALARCDAEIEKNRKSSAVVRVVDASSRPVSGATVRVEQTGHAFLFGGNIFMFDKFSSPSQNALYKNRFEELFNYATTGLYWQWYEQERGKPDYARTDKIVAWCDGRGIQVKGHPLLWGNEAGIPPWSDGQPTPEVQRRRVVDLMHRYRGKIHFWEVVNEPTLHRQPVIDEPYRWARQADPTACLIVNDCYVLADGRPLFFDLLQKAERRGVPFNAIGIQAHEPAGMWFPLDRVWAVLGQYATLGKELQITEFTPTSGGEKITGSYRKGVWDESSQAEYATKFYRLCFAHPAMRAIIWWDLCDQGAWRPGGGMLRADLTPKPVYRRLKRLIHSEWRTRLDGVTDADGRFEFRGFHGPYRITVDRGQERVERQFRLNKNGPNEWTVVP